MLGAEINQEKGPNEIAEKREEGAANYQDEPAQDREPIKFAEKKRHHEGRLERTNPGAGLIDSNETGTDFDNVAELHRRDPDGCEDFDVDQGVDAHQSLDNDLFQKGRPRNRHQEKQNGKREMPQPGYSPGQINGRGGSNDGGECQHPAE